MKRFCEKFTFWLVKRYATTCIKKHVLFEDIVPYDEEVYFQTEKSESRRNKY